MGAVEVGIDLGTTNSCVAIYRNGKVKVIRTEEDSYVIPSWVGFTECGITVGHQAKNEAYYNIRNSVYEVKRLMGQPYSNEKVQADIKQFPYKVINDEEMPKIEVYCKLKKEQYFPEEISAFILDKLKRFAESDLNQKVTHAVVTVPAYFNDFQRKATKDAAIIAGFQQVHVINEPTAAALAFSHQNSKQYKRNVMVYDFGGGTFDVSIVTVGRGKCEVKATRGDSHLGGTDINTNLVNFIKEDFKSKYGKDTEEDELTIRRIRSRCEVVKEKLSGRDLVYVELNNLSGKDYSTCISRVQFEQLNASLFEKTLDISKTCLESSGLTKDQIDEIVLVGGSSRIPKVQEMLKEYFGEKKINKGVNPDEAVAYGAAIHASNLMGNKSEVEDVLSLSLGISVLNYQDGNKHLSDILMPNNTPIPTSYTREYFTSHDDQDAVSIIVHQGEAIFAADNFHLGIFSLTELKKGPAGSTKFKVCFHVDADGILMVTATEVGSNNSKSIKIDVKKEGLSQKQIAKRTAEMQEHRQNEEKRREFVTKIHKLEVLCNTLAAKTEHFENVELKEKLKNRCRNICMRLQNLSISDQDQLEQTKIELAHLEGFATLNCDS